MRIFFENKQIETVTVNGDRYRAMWNEFCSQKLRRRILETFGCNRTAKVHLMFFAPLSAAGLMSFGRSELRFATVGVFVGCRQR